MFLTQWILPFSAMATGLYAAWLWWQSAQIEVGPTDFEPLDRAESAHWRVSALISAGQKSAILNRRAAGWTAAATFLGSVASFVDRLF